MSQLDLTPGGIATMACLLEVAASKPGNVHRGADFEDVGLTDFMASAVVMGQSIDRSDNASVGQTILTAVESTAVVAGSNTNLGMVLLLVPLATALQQTNGQLDTNSVAKVLGNLTNDDTANVFRAIQLAKPGGLGSSEQWDIADGLNSESVGLIESMSLAAERDLVAAQFANNFEQVFTDVVPLLVSGSSQFGNLTHGIVIAHLAMMAKYPDSLIARKCGPAVAAESQTRAQQVLDVVPTTTDDHAHERFWMLVSDFDFWLRSDGHRRNPGTTADLIAAGLFVAIANGEIVPPFR